VQALKEVALLPHWRCLCSTFSACAVERNLIAAAEMPGADVVRAFRSQLASAETQVRDFSKKIDDHVAKAECSDELQGLSKALATHAAATSAAITKADAAVVALLLQGLGHVRNGELLARYDINSMSLLFKGKIDIEAWGTAEQKLGLYNRIVEQLAEKGYKELAQVPRGHLALLAQLIDETLQAIGKHEIGPLGRSLTKTRDQLAGVETRSAST
jgi:hypothetical protein